MKRSRTTSIRQQMRMASKYYTGLLDTASVLLTGSITKKEDVRDGERGEFMSPGDVLCSKLVYNSQEYKIGDLVVVKATDSNSLDVGIIQTFVVKSKTVAFVLKIYEAKRNEFKYFVSKSASDGLTFMNPSSLVDFKPLVKYGTDQKFKFYLHHHISYSHD